MLQVALNGALLSIGKGLLPETQGRTYSEQKLETDEQLVHTHRKTQSLVANPKNSVVTARSYKDAMPHCALTLSS